MNYGLASRRQYWLIRNVRKLHKRASLFIYHHLKYHPSIPLLKWLITADYSGGGGWVGVMWWNLPILILVKLFASNGRLFCQLFLQQSDYNQNLCFINTSHMHCAISTLRKSKARSNLVEKLNCLKIIGFLEIGWHACFKACWLKNKEHYDLAHQVVPRGSFDRFCAAGQWRRWEKHLWSSDIWSRYLGSTALTALSPPAPGTLYPVAKEAENYRFSKIGNGEIENQLEFRWRALGLARGETLMALSSDGLLRFQDKFKLNCNMQGEQGHLTVFYDKMLTDKLTMAF